MTGTELRISLNIYEIIEDYENKKKEIPTMFEDIKKQCTELYNKCQIMGTFGDRPFKNDFSHNYVGDMTKSLKISAWRYCYNALKMEHIAPETHKKEFKKMIENPFEFNEGNIKSVFKDYVTNSRGMALMAFAEIFCGLDKFYKSHSNIKVGVKGLPKRVIIGYCGEYGYGHGNEKGADVVNAVMRYRGHYESCINASQFLDLSKEGKSYRGLSFKKFKNGNVHIIFDRDALADVNRALSEYYGNIVPDAYEHNDKPAASKEVSKDLQFYRTPEKTVKWFMGEISIHDGAKVLEPSCGDGALLDGIRNSLKADGVYQKQKYATIIGVEFDQGRCQQCRDKGYTVHNDNFLTWETRERFDYIIMNPPFYGKHYLKHIEKAYELLADGGQIISILPITARENHGIIDEKYQCRWRDLPLGSFSESGTNINTCMVRIFK